MRKCTICQQTKPDGKFKIVDGKLTHQCKDCYAKYQRQWYQDNQDFIRVRRRALYLTNCVNKLINQANELGIKVHIKCDGGFNIEAEKPND